MSEIFFIFLFRVIRGRKLYPRIARNKSKNTESQFSINKFAAKVRIMCGSDRVSSVTTASIQKTKRPVSCPRNSDKKTGRSIRSEITLLADVFTRNIKMAKSFSEEDWLWGGRRKDEGWKLAWRFHPSSFRPHPFLQWRDRAGISPASPLRPKKNGLEAIYFERTSCRLLLFAYIKSTVWSLVNIYISPA